MKTVVVTGCAGLLGSHFTRHLLKEGYRVVGVDDLSGGYAEYLPTEGTFDTFEFLPIDLSTEYAQRILDHTFARENPVACYHFAAYAAEGLSPFVRRFNYSNNVLSSMNIINTCINHDVKMIFTSSIAVYGHEKEVQLSTHREPNAVAFSEYMTPQPIDPYGVAKYAVEMDMKIAGEQHGLRYSILRPHNVVGIYQNLWDRYRNVVSIFIRRILEKKPIQIYGDGYQTRSFSDIQYCMKPFEKLMTHHDGEIFNIGSDRKTSLMDLAHLVAAVGHSNGYGSIVEHVGGRHEAKHAHCDHTKAQSLLDFKDETSLEELVDEMFMWAMKQPKKEQKTMKYEVVKGIYDYWK